MTVLITTAIIAFAISVAASLIAEKLAAPLPLLGSYLILALTHNSGIAYGLDLPAPLLTVLITVAVILLLIAAFRRHHPPFTQIAFGLILGGAAANLIDRIGDGLVTDFIRVGTFPIFNLADSAICVGVGMLVWEGVCEKVSKS